MRTEPLFHLLQARAAKLGEGVSSDLGAALREIQGSLKINLTDFGYLLSWTCAGKDQSLKVSKDAFHFYLAGDTIGNASKLDPGRNYRLENWRGAWKVWLDIAEASAVSLPPASDCGEIGLTPSFAESAPPYALWMSLPAFLVGVAAWGIGGMCAAGCAFTAALLLTVLGALFHTTHVFRTLTPIESVIISAGCLAPLAFGTHPGIWLAPLGGLVAVCVAERAGRRREGWFWGLGGVLFGLGVSGNGLGVLPGGMLMAITLAVTALFAPIRMRARGPVFFALGLSLAAAVTLHFHNFIPLSGAPESVHHLPEATLFAGVLAAALFAAFMTWWFHGSLFHTVPWFAILILSVFAAGSIVSAPAAAAVSAVSGLVLFLMLRLGAAFLGDLD